MTITNIEPEPEFTLSDVSIDKFVNSLMMYGVTCINVHVKNTGADADKMFDDADNEKDKILDRLSVALDKYPPAIRNAITAAITADLIACIDEILAKHDVYGVYDEYIKAKGGADELDR